MYCPKCMKGSNLRLTLDDFYHESTADLTPTQHTGSMNLPVSHSQKGAGGFQGGYHLFRVNQMRVINDCVDLTKIGKSAGHLFNSLQPYQG